MRPVLPLGSQVRPQALIPRILPEVLSAVLPVPGKFPCGFPLPAAAPIFKKHGVTFIYQQYEIAAYAVGMPKCSFTYEQILNLCTSTAQPLIQSTNDFIAKTLPYGKQY